MAWKKVQTPRGAAYDIPIIGDHLARTGRIIDLYATPCTPDPMVWVLAFWHAAPTFAASITKPQIIDIDIPHRNRKPRRGRGLRFYSRLVTQLDAVINVPVPRWAAFRLYEFGQRIGWYLLVADATENFAINWMSLAYLYGGCKEPNVPYILRRSDNEILWVDPPPGWHTVRYDVIAVNEININQSGGVILKPGQYRVNFSVRYTPRDPYPVFYPTHTAVFVDGQTTEDWTSPAWGDLTGNRHSSGGATIFVEDNTTVDVAIRPFSTGGQGVCNFSGEMTIYRTDSINLSPDP